VVPPRAAGTGGWSAPAVGGGRTMADGAPGGRAGAAVVGEDFMGLAERGEVVAMEAALADTPSLASFANAAGETALHGAAFSGRTEAVAVLLHAHADTEVRIKSGWTPLHMAAYWDYAEVATALLRAGANVDPTTDLGWTPLQMAMDEKASDVVSVLVAWGASRSSIRRPKMLRDRLSGQDRLLLKALDKTVPMTEQERQAAKNVRWKGAGSVATATTAVAVADPVDRSLAILQAAYDGFVADPTTLTAGTLEAALKTPSDRDMRWHVRAHHVLLFADSVGLFACETPAERGPRQVKLFAWVYQPIVTVLTPSDRRVAVTLVRQATTRGLLDPMHVNIFGLGLELHAAFFTEIVDLHQRLTHVEQHVTRNGELLFEAMNDLESLRQSLVDKAARDRKVALIKSAIKIGASLTPVVGGVLAVTVDVIAMLFGDLPGAEAVALHLADPTDLEAACSVLALVRDAEAGLTPAKVKELQAVVHPFKSIPEMRERLAWAASALELPCNAEEDGVAGAVGDTKSDDVATEAASDADSDPLKEFTDAVQDAAIECGVDEADARLGGPASSTSAPPVSPSLTFVAGAADSSCDTAVASHVPDTTFFAGALDWTARQVADRLVTYAVRGDDATERAALRAVVTPAAVELGVTGVCLVECRTPRDVALWLLGDAERLGVLVTVESFIVKVKLFAVQP